MQLYEIVQFRKWQKKAEKPHIVFQLYNRAATMSGCLIFTVTHRSYIQYRRFFQKLEYFYINRLFFFKRSICALMLLCTASYISTVFCMFAAVCMPRSDSEEKSIRAGKRTFG